VELLVVVLIIATLMAVALPLYLSAVEDCAKKTCRANMHGITNAAAAWATRTETAYSTITLSMLSTDMGSIPICPDGGTYSLQYSGTVPDDNGNLQTIPTGSIGVVCNFPGHYGFIPGVMGD
jgi:type IV pilus assembly protein PilA